MTANTFKQMTKDGTIKRADASKIEYKNIHVEPGFNLRDTTATDFNEELESLVQHMARGGKVPALEVRPREGGGVWLVDGHRRHMAYGILIERGHPIEWIAVEQFIGNDMQRTARIMTSQEGRKLKPLEVAEGYRRLAAFGLSPEDIARHVGKTRQHVDQMLILANADHAVHRMVAQGDVSATEAVNVVRQHGEKAEAVLVEAKGKAGAGKVTAKALRPFTPPAKFAAPMLQHAKSLLKDVQPEILARAGRVTTFDEPDEIVSVTVSLRSLFYLVQNIEAVEEVREAKEAKQRDKQAKAAQGELVDAEA